MTSCGGSLIHEDIVLTAGHCDDITSNQVIVGAYQNLVYGLGAELKTITQRRRHPNFFLMDQVVPEYDYLVLKLSSPVRRIDFFFFWFYPEGDQNTGFVPPSHSNHSFGSIYTLLPCFTVQFNPNTTQFQS